AEHKPEPELQGEGEEYDVERAIYMSLEMFQVHGQAPVGDVTFCEPTASGITQKLPIVEGKGKGITTDEQVAQSLLELQTPKKTSAETDKSNNEGDIEILNTGEEQGEDVTTKIDLEEKTTAIDEGQTGSDPSKIPESRPPPERKVEQSVCSALPERVLMIEDQAEPNPGQSHVALAGPNPKPMHEDFIAAMY
ncbi:hypothetical protein Tco_0083360, partial [Tanacetum coccineum]